MLGWDLPVLLDLLNENESLSEADSGGKGECTLIVSGPVLTRAQATAGVQPLPDFDSLCEGGTKRPRKSRRQRRFEKQMWSAKPEANDSLVCNMWNVPENIAVLQSQDETLKCLFAKVGNETKESCLGKEMFVLDNDVLYIVGNGCKRLVVPLSCRPLVMHLAHTVPWAGHLGCQKYSYGSVIVFFLAIYVFGHPTVLHHMP